MTAFLRPSPRFWPMMRSPVVLLLAILAATPAAAQLEFGGIPWGTSVDSARAQLQRAGYVPRGQDQAGDWVFGDATGVDLVTMFDSAGLVGVDLKWTRDFGRLPARFDRLADSLSRAFGAPQSAADDDAGERAREWTRDGARTWLFLRPRGSGMDSALVLIYEGPGWEAEFERRNEADRARDAYEEENGRADTTAYGDWVIAYSDARDLTMVDTVRFSRVGDRLYRARFLDQWFQTRRLENGMMYNGALTEVELDCGGMRARLLRTIPLYGRRATAPIEGSTWLPPLPGANHARAVARACEMLGRRPQR